MTSRPCLVCGQPSDQSRCPDHRLDDHILTRHERGYDSRWDRLSRKARKLQPFCTDCGATEDLQADHSPEAWRRKAAGKAIRLTDIDVVCGPCNRARGQAKPDTWGDHPETAGQSPEGKAQSALHTDRKVVHGG